LTIEVPAEQLLDVAVRLRDGADLKFEMCMDVCGVDYLEHGRAEWNTENATLSGFSRGVTRYATPDGAPEDPLSTGRRFAVVYQPVSIEPRVLVPKVIRHDNRYDPALTNAPVPHGEKL
jgi:NADH-quinone oxidoreductase subunit C